jgi:MerR family redox-sensitive transcriptional activator SoxR
MAAQADDWPIGELARRAGLNASAIRYYEAIELLPAPPRVSGKRRYDQSALTRLQVIDLAQRAGFTLAETRTLLEGISSNTPPSQVWQGLARRKLPEVEALIARGNAMKRLLNEGLECGCMSLEQCELLFSGA